MIMAGVEQAVEIADQVVDHLKKTRSPHPLAIFQPSKTRKILSKDGAQTMDLTHIAIPVQALQHMKDGHAQLQGEAPRLVASDPTPEQILAELERLEALLDDMGVEDPERKEKN